MTPPRPRPALARALLLAVTAVVVVGHFFPFAVEFPQHVSNRLAFDGDTMVFTEPSVAWTPEPPAWVAAAAAEESFSVVVEARSAAANQTGPARILTLSQDYQAANLTIGQEGSDLIVRLRRPGSNDYGNPWYPVAGVFAQQRWRRIEVGLQEGRVTITVDGRRIISSVQDGPVVATWDPTVRLALGNERAGGRAWEGEVRVAEVTAGGQTVDYLQPGALEVPEGWWHWPERLRDPFRLTRGEVASFVVHAATFLVLGVLLVALPRRAGQPWRAVALLCAFAALLQLGKVFVAGRHPSLIDLAIQAAFGAAGVVLGRRWWSIRPSESGLSGADDPEAGEPGRRPVAAGAQDRSADPSTGRTR